MNTDPSARREREAEQLQQDSRRVLSRYYLAEIDRRNEEFLESPDTRPNSGLREGDVSHGEVNAVIQGAEKTVIFGQQTRLRAGILMKEDERLSRFHAEKTWSGISMEPSASFPSTSSTPFSSAV